MVGRPWRNGLNMAILINMAMLSTLAMLLGFRLAAGVAIATPATGLETHGQLELAGLLPVAATELRVVGDARRRVARDGHFGA